LPPIAFVKGDGKKPIMNAILIRIPILILAAVSALAQPTITVQPTDKSVSLGAIVTNTVTATTAAPPLAYQWRFDDLALNLETNRSLILTNIQLPHGGNYTVVVSDATGSVTSRVARLTVDTTFTKITAGSIVTDSGEAWSCGWGDYTQDGFIDLVVARTGFSLLYKNNGDGSFSKITNNITTTQGDPVALWGDYDNDGLLDLFLTEFGYSQRLYRNRGDGTFTKITTGPLVADRDGAIAAAWFDYDHDGYLDVAIGKWNFPKTIYRNNRAGNFLRVASAELGDFGIGSNYIGGGAWADYDDDGDADCVFTTANQGPNKFYRNNGNGTFTHTDPAFGFGSSTNDSVGIAWEDFHNRGKLDLFIVNGRIDSRKNDFYYRNNGDGALTALTSNEVGSAVIDGSTGYGCAAADYDNDGYLDLFIGNPGFGRTGPTVTNLLHRNNGDGTFSLIELGSLTSDLANSTACAWGDYDNDGAMDLFVARGAWASFGRGPQASALYRNNGNTNRWLKLKLAGTVSNRSAIGAKVRVKATLSGQTIWQMRHVTSTGTYCAQNDARPHFGLRDATVAETVRIEWPSGIVQELRNVPANQILHVTEPARLEPQLTLTQGNGLVELKVKSWPGFVYDIEGSSDLEAWMRLTTFTNETGTFSFPDPLAAGAQRFYRAVGQ
jgi:hypothetical protein